MILIRSTAALHTLQARAGFLPPRACGVVVARSSQSDTAPVAVEHPLVAEISKLANEIRAMKATKAATKDEVMTKVHLLNVLRAELATATGQPAPAPSLNKRDKAAASRKSRFALEGGRIPPPPSSFPEGSYDKRAFFRHEIIHVSTKSGARVGRIHTPHGVIDTPGFVAVATNGAVKALDIKDAGT
jgi:hypothetical protein